MASGANNVVDTSMTKASTLVRGSDTHVSSNGSGASAVDSSPLLASFLYYLVQNGLNFQPWAYAAMALALQSSVASTVNTGENGNLTPTGADQINLDWGGSNGIEASAASGTEVLPNGAAPGSLSSYGARDQLPPFVYQDAAGATATPSLAPTGSGAASLNNPLFNSWGAVLSPPFAAGQALVDALDQTGGASNSLLASTSLAQGQGGLS